MTPFPVLDQGLAGPTVTLDGSNSMEPGKFGAKRESPGACDSDNLDAEEDCQGRRLASRTV